jgi:hypothetical protein
MTLLELVRKWRASANKAEQHLGDPDMDTENQTHMRDMRMCADELEAALTTHGDRAPLTARTKRGWMGARSESDLGD